MRDPVETRMTGAQFRKLRQKFGLSQVQLASKLGIPKGSLNVAEWRRNELVPPRLEKALLQFVADGDYAPPGPKPRKRSWGTSKNFSIPAPFKNLPTPGSACGCEDKRCALDPKEDADHGSSGHFWKFRGRKCKKTVWLNNRGKAVSAPPPRRQHSVIPPEVCSSCGRNRALGKKRIAKLGRVVYRRYCRKSGKPRCSAAPSYFWEVGGRIEPIPAHIWSQLKTRTQRSFPTPVCANERCPGIGRTLEASGERLNGRIAAFRCRGGHWDFRVIPGGERAERDGYACYQWTDSDTGEIRTIKGEKMGRKVAKPLPPKKLCPDHNVPLQNHYGPWQNKKTRKLVWGAFCPIDGRRWLVSAGRAPRKHTRLRWTKRGRPAGVSRDTLDRARVAAAFLKCGLTMQEMSVHLFPGTPKTAYDNTKSFFRRQRALIESAKARLTTAEAHRITDGALKPI